MAVNIIVIIVVVVLVGFIVYRYCFEDKIKARRSKKQSKFQRVKKK